MHDAKSELLPAYTRADVGRALVALSVASGVVCSRTAFVAVNLNQHSAAECTSAMRSLWALTTSPAMVLTQLKVAKPKSAPAPGPVSVRLILVSLLLTHTQNALVPRCCVSAAHPDRPPSM